VIITHPPTPPDVILWEHQIPPGTLVVLSGRDVLMETKEARLGGG
jgi:hypothetical protein